MRFFLQQLRGEMDYIKMGRTHCRLFLTAGDRRQKCLGGLDAKHGGLQVGEVRLERSLASVLQRPDAIELAPPNAGGMRRHAMSLLRLARARPAVGRWTAAGGSGWLARTHRHTE